MATLFNDKIFAPKAFQQLVKSLIPLRAFATDITPEVKSTGDAVIVGLFGNVTTTTFVQANDAYEQTGGAVTAITVNLNKRYITPVNLTAQQLAESQHASKFDEFAKQMGSATAQRVLTDVFSVLTTSNFGAAILSTYPSTGYGRDTIVKARQVLQKRGVPKDGRSFVMNYDIEGSLLSDDKLTLAINRGSSAPIDEADLGRVLGFNLYSTDTIPLNSISLAGFACGRNSIAVAMRNLGQYLPPEEYEALEIMTDPESGISAVYTRHWSRASGQWFLNMHVLYGYSPAVTLEMGLITVP